MSHGTTINQLYVPRLHRATAQDTLAEARDELDLARARLIYMAAAATPTPDENGDPSIRVIATINEIVDTIAAAALAIRLAEHLIHNPEHCRDDADYAAKQEAWP